MTNLYCLKENKHAKEFRIYHVNHNNFELRLVCNNLDDVANYFQKRNGSRTKLNFTDGGYKVRYFVTEEK